MTRWTITGFAAALTLVLAILASTALTTPSRATTGNAVRRIRIWMMGRSVMGGWFSHWGSDGTTPVYRGRFKLVYKELQPPPELISSARNHLQSVTRPPNVFFKLCFVDFEGGSQAAAEANLARNKRRILRMYSMVRVYKRRLLIGNALPKVAGDTDTWLVWNHRRYNRWLRSFAAGRPRVYIFNQYAVLRDASGNLRADYAADPGDSHLNESAYTALDNAFLPWLNSTF